MASLLNDFLDALGVPHTREYADRAFATMPFKSLFGLSRQLKAYGIDNVAAQWTDKSVLPSIPTPFLARTADGRFVIVETIDTAGGEVTYRCRHEGVCTVSVPDFEKIWSGLALLAYPSETSAEPDLAAHRFKAATARAKSWILALCAVILLGAGIVHAAVYSSLSRIALLLVDIAGLGVTWLLILKTLKVSSKSADRICAVMQDHGCDTVLEQKASTFYGIFSWSEVGLSYFAVSTLTLLIFPGALPLLALINLCCLPFTFWSIWYQHWRLRTWCTLCVTTQALLWLQAGAYLWAGAWSGAISLPASVIILLAAYGAALLATNRIVTFIKRYGNKES